MGVSSFRVLLRNLRCCFVKMTTGSAEVDDAPDAYPDSSPELDRRWAPIVKVLYVELLFLCS